MKKLLLTLFFAASASIAQAETAFYVAKMHAEWCGVCKLMNPKIPAVKAAFEGSNIEFIQFDFTNNETVAANNKRAAELNLTTALNEHRGRTGFLAVINAKTQENIGQISGWLTAEQMIASIQQFTQEKDF